MPPPIFPTFPGLTFPIKRTPLWSTIRQESIGGQTPRFSLWSYPRYRYELSISVLRRFGAFAELDAILGFYNAVAGAAGVFQYADNTDNAVTAQAFGTGDGTTTAFQLVRSFGGFMEPVYAPTGTPAIYKAGVLQTPVTHYTVGSTGLVTFTAAPAMGTALTWTGGFNWLCQFDDDELELREELSARWAIETLRFTTIKL
jgi:uncharacterized protein (TIGR02217 family)